MSYELHVANDAHADFRQLEAWLQEEVIDELELVAADPDLIGPASEELEQSYFFTVLVDGLARVVLITLSRNDDAQIIYVLGVTLFD